MADQPRGNQQGESVTPPGNAAELRSARDERRRTRKRRRNLLALGIMVAAVVVGVSAYGLAHGANSKRTASETGGRTLTSASATSSASAEEATASSAATETASLEATTAAPLRTYPTEGQRTIVVYRSEQHVVLFDESGQQVAEYLCSTGRVDPHPGTYRVTSHKPSSTWEDKHFYYFTIFTQTERGNNIGFHAIPLDSKGNLVGADQLGKPVSAGCVRLEAPNAKFLYDWAANGTRVVVVK